MGITDAFSNDLARFSGICPEPIDGPVYVDEVIHKTYIDVNKDGTTAGAATIVDMKGDGFDDYSYLPTVRIDFDRPFVYMIIDRENMMPIMIGTLMTLEG